MSVVIRVHVQLGMSSQSLTTLVEASSFLVADQHPHRQSSSEFQDLKQAMLNVVWSLVSQ